MEEAAQDIINVQIPQIKALMNSGDLHVENIDVFCEKGVFECDSTKQILEAGVAAGMAINFHGDELHPMQAAELGASLGARAISHLEEVSDAGIAAMAEKGTVAVLLPTTAYILRLKPPPARQMIDSDHGVTLPLPPGFAGGFSCMVITTAMAAATAEATSAAALVSIGHAGVPVALGSDFNPNAHCLSMPAVMHLACCIMRMSMVEALAASTINAAASIGRAKTHGSLEVGKQADILVLNASRWEHLIYQLAGHDEVIDYVIKAGEVVFSKTPAL